MNKGQQELDNEKKQDWVDAFDATSVEEAQRPNNLST